MARLLATLAALALLLAAAPAEAHKLKVFAAAVGPRIEGSVYFVGGDPAPGARLNVATPDGEAITAMSADDAGRFAFTAERRVDHVIVADTGDGHSARFTVLARDLPDTLPPPSLSGAQASELSIRPPTAAPAVAVAPFANAGDLREIVGEAVAQQIVPLREQLNGYEDRVRLHDVLGGLGYILGLAGLALWLRAHRTTAGQRR